MDQSTVPYLLALEKAHWTFFWVGVQKIVQQDATICFEGLSEGKVIIVFAYQYFSLELHVKQIQECQHLGRLDSRKDMT